MSMAGRPRRGAVPGRANSPAGPAPPLPLPPGPAPAGRPEEAEPRGWGPRSSREGAREQAVPGGEGRAG